MDPLKTPQNFVKKSLRHHQRLAQRGERVCYVLPKSEWHPDGLGLTASV